jgi:hypothetical protein
LTDAVGERIRWYANGLSGFGGGWKNDIFERTECVSGSNYQNPVRESWFRHNISSEVLTYCVAADGYSEASLP